MNNLRPLLTDMITRIEGLEVEAKEIRDRKNLVFAEAKTHGLDVKVIRLILQRRKVDPEVREELEALLDTYEEALKA